MQWTILVIAILILGMIVISTTAITILALSASKARPPQAVVPSSSSINHQRAFVLSYIAVHSSANMPQSERDGPNLDFGSLCFRTINCEYVLLDLMKIICVKHDVARIVIVSVNEIPYAALNGINESDMHTFIPVAKQTV